MEMSEQIGDLVLALAKAKLEMPAPPKDKVGKGGGKTAASYEYGYSSIEAIMKACGIPLAKHDLVLMHFMGLNEAQHPCLTALLAHKSGQWIKESVPLVVGQTLDARDLGKACTYARRYTTLSILGFSDGDEVIDDDGEANEGYKIAIKKKEPVKKAVPVEEEISFLAKTVTPDQVAQILMLAPPDSQVYKDILKNKKIADITQFPADSFDKLMAYLKGL